LTAQAGYEFTGPLIDLGSDWRVDDGSITGMVDATASGTITCADLIGITFTDGILSISEGSILDAVDITSSGTITSGTFTDGTMTITGGEIIDATGLISMWTNDSAYITLTDLSATAPIIYTTGVFSLDYDVNDFYLNGTTLEVNDLGGDHGGLSGLTDDDHTMYWESDGSDDATGDWTLDTNSITLTAGTLTADTITDGTFSITGGDSTTTGSGSFGDLVVDTNLIYTDATNHIVGIGTTSPQQLLHIQGHAALGYLDGSVTNRMDFYQGVNGTAGYAGRIRADYDHFYLTNDYGRVYIEKAADEAHALAIQEADTPYQTQTWWFDGSSATGTGMWFHSPSLAGDMNFKLGTNNGNSNFNVMDSDESVLFIIEDQGNVGIGATPTVKLDVSGDVNVAGTGTFETVAIVATVNHTITNDSNDLVVTNSNTNKDILFDVNDGGTMVSPLIVVGEYKGLKSEGCTVSGNWGTALGQLTTSAGRGFAVGRSTNAGLYGFAAGRGTDASGQYGFATGYNTTASGQYSFAAGNTTTASGTGAVAIGVGTLANDSYTFAFGGAYSFGGTATVNAGSVGSITGGYAFADNIDTVIVTQQPGSMATGYARDANILAYGSGSRAHGWADGGNIEALGDGSVAMGYGITNYPVLAGQAAEDKGAVSLGYSTRALGIGCIALGFDTCAGSNDYCTAIGKDFTNSTTNSVGLGIDDRDFLLEAATLKYTGTSYFGDGGSANYSSFASNGILTMTGTARSTNALWIGANEVKAPPTKAADFVDHGISGAWEFSDATDDTIVANMRIPNRMDRTAAPTLTIGWSSTTTDANCIWQVEYLWRAVDEDTTANADDTLLANTDADIYVSSSTPEGMILTTFTLAAPSVTDACLHLRIKRRADLAADTIDADTAELHGICMTFTSNKLGT